MKYTYEMACRGKVNNTERIYRKHMCSFVVGVIYRYSAHINEHSHFSSQSHITYSSGEEMVNSKFELIIFFFYLFIFLFSQSQRKQK